MFRSPLQGQLVWFPMPKPCASGEHDVGLPKVVPTNMMSAFLEILLRIGSTIGPDYTSTSSALEAGSRVCLHRHYLSFHPIVARASF